MSEVASGTDHIAEANAQLASEDTLWAALKDQSKSMLGMAGMFVITIVLGIFLQPFYSDAELHAFGEAGATQGRYIALELGMIFVFTAGIILLARWKKQWLIKYGILFIVWIALSYATVPLAHYALAPNDEVTPFAWEEERVEPDYFLGHMNSTSYLTSLHLDADESQAAGHNFTMLNPANQTINVSSHTITLRTGLAGDEVWNYTHRSPFTTVYQPWITYGGDSLGFTNGFDWWMLDPVTLEQVGQERECYNVLKTTNAECRAAFIYNEELYAVTSDGFLVTLDPYHNNTPKTWGLSEHGIHANDGLIHTRLVGEDNFLIVADNMAILFEIPTEATPIGVIESERDADMIPHLWNMTAPEGQTFTAFEWGFSPASDVANSENTGETMFMLLGTSGGDVYGFDVDTGFRGKATPAEWMNLDGNSAITAPVQAIRLADWNDGGLNDLLIYDGDGLQMLQGQVLVRALDINAPANSTSTTQGGEAILLELGPSPDVESGESQYSNVGLLDEGVWISGPIEEDMMEHGFLIYTIPFLVGIIVSTLLMILLWLHPEWYTVNTVGILVGAGVITLLGISFVPWLIIIFMIAAACYDAWAVYRSKHMLELADTMIGLNLPILLVAPQDKGYSMLEEDDDRMRQAAEGVQAATDSDGSFKAKAAQAKATGKTQKSTQEAMFMGLGDVIFPGMLVISAMTWLAPIGGEENAILVALGTMVGGLLGYFALMTYVARGRPQAGLPLLNGGSILGFVLASLIFIGSEALAFNITF